MHSPQLPTFAVTAPLPYAPIANSALERGGAPAGLSLAAPPGIVVALPHAPRPGSQGGQ